MTRRLALLAVAVAFAAFAQSGGVVSGRVTVKMGSNDIKRSP